MIVVPTAIFALSTIIIATADAEDYGGGSPGYNDGAKHISTDGKTSARRRRRTRRLAGRSRQTPAKRTDNQPLAVLSTAKEHSPTLGEGCMINSHPEINDPPGASEWRLSCMA